MGGGNWVWMWVEGIGCRDLDVGVDVGNWVKGI